MVSSTLRITESLATGSRSASKADRENGHKRLIHSPRTLHACKLLVWRQMNRGLDDEPSSPPLQQRPTLHLPWRSVITFSARVVLVPMRKGFIEFTHIVITQSMWFPLSICGHLYQASAVKRASRLGNTHIHTLVVTLGVL